MKVHELITELQKYDPNLDVFWLADGEYWLETPTLITPQIWYHNGSDLPHDLKLDYISDKENEIIDHIRKNGYINLGIL